MASSLALIGAERPDFLGHIVDNMGEEVAFGGGYPVHAEPVFFDAELLERPFEQHHAPQGLVVTFGVVAVARVAAQHQHAVGPEFKGSQDEGGLDAAAAHNADGADIGGALHSGGACQICPAV